MSQGRVPLSQPKVRKILDTTVSTIDALGYSNFSQQYCYPPSFALFPAGQSFLLGNMIEHDHARRYLQETCPTVGYKICSIAKCLPATSYELLWATDAYRELGGFDGMREEAAQIVLSTFHSGPWDVLQMAVDTVGSSFVTRAPGAELGPLPNHSWMIDVLTKKFGLATVRDTRTALNRKMPSRVRCCEPSTISVSRLLPSDF